MILPGAPPLTRDLEILLRLIAPPPRPSVPPDGIDWPAIDDLARHTHVTARLWSALKDDPLLASVPPALAEGLRAEFVAAARRNRLLKTQIAGVARHLNARGLTPVVLKGGAYIFDPPSGTAALRYLHDLDFLAADSGACQDCLLASGFRELGKIERPRAERSYHHWPALVDPQSGLEVEVHKRPFISADRAMTALFLAEAVPVEHDGARLLLPSRACRIVANVIHSQISDRGLGRAWFNPRYLAEFAEYAAAWPAADWRLAEAAMAGNRVAFGSFRHMAEALMGVAVPLPRATRRIDALQLARIRRHDRFRPRLGPAGLLIERLGLVKDRLRRHVGHWIGWQSVPRTRLQGAASA